VAGTAQVLALDAGEWRFPLAALQSRGNRLTARARLVVGTWEHEVEVAEWVVSLEDGQVTLDEGAQVPFFDLGARFGGWWAPEAYDEPGRYHLPRNQPIPVTPPATPTIGPSQTPRPRASAEPTVTQEPPTATPPSATPTAWPPGSLHLPWAVRGARRPR
jgi:hypothetical protein